MDFLDTAYRGSLGADYALLPCPRDTLYNSA